jgi:organic radical activating enzyme
MWCLPAASRALQLDTPLLGALEARGFECAVETNGTLGSARRRGLDLRLAPSRNQSWRRTRGHELKFVYPQDESIARPICRAGF